ncbi:MAG: hypothetical protein SNH35_05015 [Rikenellaceae bacterium]
MRRLLTLFIFLLLAMPLNGFSAENKKAKSGGVTTAKVSSLDELLPYLAMDSVQLTMTPGTYRISVADIKAGKYSKITYVRPEQVTYAMLLVEGNGGVFDLTGVTIEVETGVPSAYPGSKYFEVAELHIIGNSNVVKGLTLVDVGDINQNPRYGWCNVIMDGISNRVEGVEVRSMGSMPYGYGEVFGKGRGAKISHRKHSSWLVRGNKNHVKDCRIIQRSYGHYLFMQGAQDPLIEGCYIEGDMVSTEQILSQKGTGSKADKVNFETVFGYKVPEGYTLSTGEDGIRTYANGTTYINGESVTQPTGGEIIIRNCTVKHTRSGISLTLGQGSRLVENCTLIGCQDGYSINSGSKIINCRADAEFGPALRFVSNRDRNSQIDLTIIPYEGERKFSGNGSKHVAHIFGSGHNITLRRGEGLKLKDDMYIAVGGDSRTIGNLGSDQNFIGNEITLSSDLGCPIVMDDNTKNGKITTNGEVVDNGVDNTITKK